MTSEINLPIYMDYASTTPVDPRVAKKISDHLTLDGNFGNPASRSHKFGWKAEEAVEEARSHVANLVNCDPREIVWTSGATEADNLAIKGIANFYQKNGKHIITSKIEQFVNGKWTAVFLSSAIFTLHHSIALVFFLDPLGAVIASLGVFIGGSIFSWLYIEYRSIWVAWVAHACADVAIFAIAWELIVGF